MDDHLPSERSADHLIRNRLAESQMPKTSRCDSSVNSVECLVKWRLSRWRATPGHHARAFLSYSLIAWSVCAFIVYEGIHSNRDLTPAIFELYRSLLKSGEGAFKKLKNEPVVSPGPQHAGHTPTTASCPTPARRRHRTTFTQ
ncbi:unnamed protein product, partial [Nesidiocoris tenuis]